MVLAARESYIRGTGKRGRKKRRRRKHMRETQEEWQRLGIEDAGSATDRYGNPSDPNTIMNALDELGFSKFLPGRWTAKEVQFQAGKKVARRNEMITSGSRDMLLGQQRLVESRRPGGATAMMSPLVGQAAQVNLQRRTVAPDLLTRVRDAELQRARKAASDAQTKQLIGSTIQAVGAVAGGVLGGPAGAAAGAAAGGAIGGAVAGGGGGGPGGAGQPQFSTYQEPGPPVPALDAPAASPGGPVPGGLGGPVTGGQPGGAQGPSGGGGAAGPAGGGGGPAGGGGGPAGAAVGGPAAGAVGQGAAEAGGSAGDVAMAMDPSFPGAVSGVLAEMGPDASVIQVFAYDAAAEALGFDDWLDQFWQDVA